MTFHYDCIVLGGGPAGSTVAALVAAGGRRTLLLERDAAPRPHAGESILPEAAGTLARLGLLERIDAERFPRKASVQFVDSAGRAAEPFRFRGEEPDRCAAGWNVDRAAFDQLLFDRASALGVECRRGVLAVEALFEERRAVGVRAELPDGEQVFRCRGLVDATGQQALLARQLGLREPPEGPRHAAIWTHYRGGRRDGGPWDGSTLLLQTRDRKSWFWYVPLSDDLVGVGVVAGVEHLLRGRGRPEAVFEEELVGCPAVAERLIDASLAGEFRVARDLEHATSPAAGEGWLLVGDAFAALAPLLSAGVFLALRSGEWAADALLQGLARDDLSGEQLGGWTGDFRTGIDRLRRLGAAFYHTRFGADEYVRSMPRRCDALADLLAGKVFRPAAGAALEELEYWLARGADCPEPAREAPADTAG